MWNCFMATEKSWYDALFDDIYSSINAWTIILTEIQNLMKLSTNITQKQPRAIYEKNIPG